MLANVAIKILANAGALWAATRYVPGFELLPTEFFRIELFAVDPLLQTFIAAGIVLAVANALLYPILKIVAAILPFVTTAMLVVLLNAALVYAGAAFLPAAITVAGLQPLLWTALLLGIINSLI